MENGNRAASSIKWSVLTELLVKLISPVTSMILARLIDPKAFGVVSSILIITAFAEMFTDGGFQSYLIRHQFRSDEEFSKYVSVVFWSNFGISAFFVIGIFMLAPYLAGMIGVEEHTNAIQGYSFILLLTSYSGTQYAVCRKKFKFKELGKMRIIGKLTSLFVTVPLAFLGLGFWAIIIGNIVSEAIIDLFLLIKPEEKICFFYDLSCFVKMLHYSFGILLNSVVAFAMTNLSILLIGVVFGVYEQGIYQMAFNVVGQITSMITASTMGVFLSDLSLRQREREGFNETVYQYQQGIGIISIPLGVGFLVFRVFVTNVFLGDLYADAALLVGLLGFVICESITFIEIGQNICWAKGKPYYVVISNSLQTILIFVVICMAREWDFQFFAIVLCVVKLQVTITHYLFARKSCGLSVVKSIGNLLPYYAASAVMGASGICILKLSGKSTGVYIVGIILSVAVYAAVLFMIPRSRMVLSEYFCKIKSTFMRVIHKDA